MSEHSTSTIQLEGPSLRFYQGVAAGQKVADGHADQPIPDFQQRLNLFWFYVGAVAVDEYGCKEPDELATFIAGKVYVVAFCPATSEKASTGGHEWRIELDDARQEYDRQVAESKQFDGSHIVRLLEVEVDLDPLYVTSNAAITDELDSRHDELEDEHHALRQYVPGDSEYPPTGSVDHVDA
jgi:hypothetical protein